MKFELNIEKIKERILSHQVLSKEEEIEILSQYIKLSNTEVYEWSVKIDKYTGDNIYNINNLIVFEDEIVNQIIM
jgi:hypothetical protein